MEVHCVDECEDWELGATVENKLVCLHDDYCSDGKRFTELEEEECDDKNEDEFDGCSKDCLIEPGYICGSYDPPSADYEDTCDPGCEKSCSDDACDIVFEEDEITIACT